MTTKTQLDELTKDLYKILDLPDRRPVSKVVAESLYIGAGQPWNPDRAPYMVRPLDETQNRYHNTVCFVGPARCGKTMALILGLYIYIVTKRPRDSILVHSAQDLARDISHRELERMHKYSPALAEAMTGHKSDDNAYDKRYSSGIQFNIAWPSNTQLASRTFFNALLTDYDRWPGNVGGEGSGYLQALKRLQNAGSAGMCVVESSPGGIWLDPTWRRGQFLPGQPLSHVFPEVITGARANICSIYNDGTREWWYVPCSACGEYYPLWPGIESFGWTDDPDPLKASADAGALCCWCGAIHPESEKRTENENGVWLAEGEVIDCNGKVTGESRRGEVYASFALGGSAACDQPRHDVVRKYLTALSVAEAIGDEKDLKTAVNQDIGAPMRPRLSGKLRNPNPLADRAEELGQWVVPPGVRFLIATVDVQKNRFVVQVQGFGCNQYEERERWIIDRYNLRKSPRFNPDEHQTQFDVDPAGYLEDWDLLDKLLTKSYPLADGSGRRMSILVTGCDSGGADGVTLRARDYWLGLNKKGGASLQNRLRLVKGAARDTAKLVHEDLPDTAGKKGRGVFHGDVPLITINTALIKDRLAADLERETSGPGYTHFPRWLKQWWYEELTREQRTMKGWTSPEKNEAWDLMVYAEALAIWGPIRLLKPAPNGLHRIDWGNPPRWAAEWDDNTMVFHPDDPDEGQKHGGFSADDWAF